MTMTNLLSDFRYAFRVLRRSPLFTVVAVFSLALGIGANTAIFSLLDQIVLRKLPIKEPESLVMLYQRGPHMGSNMGTRMHSYPVYRDLQQKAEPLAEVICRREISVSLSVDNQTERVDAEMVSGNFFSMLGVGPAVGRVFNSKEDDRVWQGHPSVVLNHAYWQSRFAGDPNVVGKKILVNNYPMTIVGVSAAGFIGLDPVQAPQIRVPILMKPQMAPEWPWLEVENRRARWVQVFARLKPGYTVESAAAPLQGFWRQNREYEMTLPAAAKWSAYDREQFVKGTLHVESAATGFSGVRNSFSSALFVLMAMVGAVLLIACVNVANLLIARALARQKEVSVRLSIGATRGQLVRQLLVESMVLSLGGGAVGILVAFALTGGLLRLVPVEGNPLLIRPTPDARILLFALGVSVLTALVFGLLPAFRATRLDVWSTMKDAIGSIAGPRGTSLLLRKSLIAAQVALSFLLLFGAGLFVRSLQNLKSTNTGFDEISNLVTFQLSPALNGYDVPRAVSFYRDLLDGIRAIPGVQAAAFTTVPVLSGDEWDSSTMVEGHQAKDGEDMQAFMNSPSPGYFKTMGVPVVEGRDFDERDVRPSAKVAIVNQRFAKHFFGDKSAIGRHIGQGGRNAKLETEIIGVVADRFV
jgi:predicted permease